MSASKYPAIRIRHSPHLAIRGIEAVAKCEVRSESVEVKKSRPFGIRNSAFAISRADTFRHVQHPDLRAEWQIANAEVRMWNYERKGACVYGFVICHSLTSTFFTRNPAALFFPSSMCSVLRRPVSRRWVRYFTAPSSRLWMLR